MVFGSILLGIFVFFILPPVIKWGYETIRDKIDENKRIKLNEQFAIEKAEKDAEVKRIKEDKTNVVSTERFGLSYGFFTINGKSFDYFLSEDGNTVLGPYTKILASFAEHDGMAPVQIGESVYYINTKGEKILGPFAVDKKHKLEYSGFKNGYAIISFYKHFNYVPKTARIIINTQGEVVWIIPEEQYVAQPSDGLIAIKKEDGIYFIDEDGKNALGPYQCASFETHTYFNEGFAVIYTEGANWYINKKGEKVFGPYEKAYSFTDGFAPVEIEDKGFACINRNGELIWGPDDSFKGNYMFYCPSDGCIILHTYSSNARLKHTLIDVRNQKVIGRYLSSGWMKNGYAMIEDENAQKKIIDRKGNEILDLKSSGYHARYPHNSDGAWFSVNLLHENKEEDYYCIDITGKMLKIRRDLIEKLENTPIIDENIENTPNPFVQACLEELDNNENENKQPTNKHDEKKLDINKQEERENKEEIQNKQNEDSEIYAKINDHIALCKQINMLAFSFDGNIPIDWHFSLKYLDEYFSVKKSLIGTQGKGILFVKNVISIIEKEKEFFTLVGESYSGKKYYVAVVDGEVRFSNEPLMIYSESLLHDDKSLEQINGLEDELFYILRENRFDLERETLTSKEVLKKVFDGFNIPIGNNKKVVVRIYDKGTEGDFEVNYEGEEIHIVGVRFMNQTTGCYYYLGDNNIYNIGDTVEVNTRNNGRQYAKVVYRCVYKDEDKLPYKLEELSSIIRKVNN